MNYFASMYYADYSQKGTNIWNTEFVKGPCVEDGKLLPAYFFVSYF